MRLVYFAWVREAIGCAGEERDIPDTIETVDQCIEWLAELDAHYATAFADRTRLRFALNQKMVRGDASLTGMSELAIFPPVTGG